jgi:hypothetical protein
VDNTDAVSSVNGYTGAVSLVTGDVLEGAGSLPSRPSQLYFTDARARLALSAGTGISYDNTTGVITNASPDQTVALTGAGTTSISGTYPNFTITSNDQYVGTVTSVATSAPLTGGTITTTGTIGITQSSSVADGYLSSTDWNTFNAKEPAVTKGNLTEATSSVLTITGGTGAVIGSGTSIQVKQASSTVSGFLSSTDWTTFNNKQNALTNPVTGTGTSGQVAYFNGTSSITSESNLFWDATNDRLGVGTASPGAKLEIFGTGNTLRLESAANGAKTILLRNVGTATAEIKTDGNLDFNIEDANRTMRFLTSNAERMRITSGGSLQVGGTAEPGKISLFQNDTKTYSATGNFNSDLFVVRVNSSSTNNQIASLQLAASGNAGTAAGRATISVVQTSATANTGDLVIQTNSAGTFGERLRIASTGAATFSTSVTAGDQIKVTGSGAYLSIYDTQASSKNWAIRAGHDAVGDLAIRQSNSTGGDPVSAGTTRLYINASGNVGIGTASPGYRLQAVNTTTDDAAAAFQNTISSGYSGAHLLNNSGTLMGHWGYGNASVSGPLADLVYFGSIASKAVVFTTNDTERMRISSGGNLNFNTVGATAYVNINQGSGIDGGLLFLRANNNRWQQALSNPGDNLLFYSYGISNTVLTLAYSTGAATFASSIQTGAPSGGTAKPIKFGAVQAASSLTGDALQVEVDGVTYLLGIVSPP